MGKLVLVYGNRGTFVGKVKTTSPLTITEPVLLLPDPQNQKGFRPQPLPVTELIFKDFDCYGPATDQFVEMYNKAKIELQGIKLAQPNDLAKAAKVLQHQQRLKG